MFRADLRRLRAIGLLAAFVSAPAVRAEPQSIAISDPRPVAAAMERLESVFGIPITYEDPPYSDPRTIVDVTSAVRRGREDLGAGRVLIPRGSDFSFSFDAPTAPVGGSRPPAVALATGQRRPVFGDAASRAISSALKSHADSGDSTVFSAMRDGHGGFHVVPVRVSNPAGHLEPARPLFDTAISIGAKKRMGMELVSEICESLSMSTGTKVFVGTFPVSLFAAWVSAVTAVDEPARSVLDRFLGESAVLLSWQLFYDPGLRLYTLNIHPVRSVQRETR